MNTDANLIRNNGRIRIANLEVDGLPGKIDLVRTNRDAATGSARFMLKMKGEKECRIVSVADNMNSDNFRDVLDAYIDTSFITEWKV